MMMKTQAHTSFHLAGIQVRTENTGGKAIQDIPALWQRFFETAVMQRIPHRIDDTVYCVYTDYAGDHTQPYTAFLGCRVSEPGSLPEGISALEVPGGRYVAHTVKGNLNEGLVFKAWESIWQSDLKRAYTADYEVYGPNAVDPQAAEVTIFVAIHDGHY